MTDDKSEIPESIRVGRRALEAIEGFTFLDDVRWHEESGLWILHCRLEIPNVPGGQIPSSTDWYIVMESRYPAGKVRIFPSHNNGISATFVHQTYNSSSTKGRPWRTGEICVTTPNWILGRLTPQDEPRSAEARLHWKVVRGLEWLKATALGELPGEGDPYELPQFLTISPVLFAFSEDSTTFQSWSEIANQSGLLDLICDESGDRKKVAPTCFRSYDGSALMQVSWGSYFAESASTYSEEGIWIRLKSPPLIGPWQAPVNWGEFRQALRSQDIDLRTLVSRLSTKIRDGKEHILVLGFPIPDHFGKANSQLHWQAVRIPPLALPRERPRDGFRNNELGRISQDLAVVFGPTNTIDWISSNNWNTNYAHARGRLSEKFQYKKVLIVGAGALGSALAELMVRAGLTRLIICDKEDIEYGNLSRHLLTLREVGQNKAKALAMRLSTVSAHLNVEAFSGLFPLLSEQEIGKVADCDLILDCTAEEDTLSAMEYFPWKPETLIMTFSFGWYVQRLYFSSTPSSKFSADNLNRVFDPLIDEDNRRHSGASTLREGAGCWHPIFPGRIDNVWMMSAAGLKEIERALEEVPEQMRAVVHEWSNTPEFAGLTRRDITIKL